MVKGFTDSKGKFRPTENNSGTSSREKSTRTTGMSEKRAREFVHMFLTCRCFTLLIVFGSRVTETISTFNDLRFFDFPLPRSGLNLPVASLKPLTIYHHSVTSSTSKPCCTCETSSSSFSSNFSACLSVISSPVLPS